MRCAYIRIVANGSYLSSVLLLSLWLTPAHAHHPYASCALQDEQVVLCKAGFSDGSGASSVSVDVVADDETILESGQLDAKSTFLFRRPAGGFYVVVDAGVGHVVEIDDTEIK